ncbi:MAG TPA: MFS transporter, partial [Mycobacterium sp.]|nr:MFS transporter [Mycobacterium sp.]
FSGRQPRHRPALVLATIAGCTLAWAAVLVLPSAAPGWLLVVLVVVISAAQPVSLLAFDFARDFNPPATLGTAQGIVNMGGFTASLLVMLAMGWIITAAGGYSFPAFRVAWLPLFAVWLVAAVGVIRTRGKAGATGFDDHTRQPAATGG